MKTVILDRLSLGEDTPIERLYSFSEVVSYDKTEPDLIKERIKGADVVIINKVKMTRAILEKAEGLKLICLFATGYDNVDIEAAREYGIAVCNVPGYSTDSVALLTVSSTLALYTHLYEYRSFVSSGEYSKSDSPNKLTPVYHELRGKVWGIVGYGNIGRAVGRIAEAFGARVIATKRTPTDEVECTDLATLCRESDIITLHCPLTKETEGMINSDSISLMKKSVVLYNAARGKVVVEEDVARAIEEGRIAAFGSDVFSEEPFGKDSPFDRIKRFDNVIFTPHTAWGAYESRCRCMNIVCDNIESFVNSKTLNRVDI